MSDYRLFLDVAVFEYLGNLRGAKRERLKEAFERIRQRPAESSDYSELDKKGRLIHTHVSGAHAIRYWEDFADRHLKILEIGPADLDRQ